MCKITKIRTLIFLMISIIFIAFTRQVNAQYYTIQANTTLTWGTGGVSVPVNDIANKNIVLEAGATLYINSTILQMTQGKSIRLSKNSKIYIDNTNISSTSSFPWAGFIFVNQSLNQGDIPGCVIIRNFSEIWSTTTLFSRIGSSGGGIIATESKFVNHEKFAYFIYNSPYNYGLKIYTQFTFTKCTFTQDQCGWTSANSKYFELKNTNNVKFIGCNFYNGCSNFSHAIYAKNCRITIRDHYDLYSGISTPSVFSGFQLGTLQEDGAIYIENSGSLWEKVVIAKCRFESSTSGSYTYPLNDQAITLKGCTNPEVYLNYIKLESNSPYSTVKHGIYLENCTGFTLEENEIEAVSSSGNPLNTYGIKIQNSGINTNQVYLNFLTNCEIGIQAEGKNRGPAMYYYNGNQGLKFLCNEFSSFNDAYYMTSVTCPNPPCTTNNSVSKFQQGALAEFADDASSNFNKTPYRANSSSDYDFHVASGLSTQNGFDIQYITPIQPGTTYTIAWYDKLTSNKAISVNDDGVNTPNTSHCESRSPCVGVHCAVLVGPHSISTYDPTFSTLKVQLNDLVNAGYSSALMSLVLNVTSSNVIEVYQEVKESNPSHDILALVCANDLFTTAMIEDILITNNYGIKSQEVRNALNERADKLSRQQMDEIYIAASTLSEYETILMQLDNIQTEYLRLMNASIDVLCRRDSIPTDSVKLYLSAIGDLSSTIRLIDIEFNEGNFQVAQELNNGISNLTNDDEEINTYTGLYEILYDIYTNHDGDFTNLTTTQFSQLMTISTTNTYAGGIAKYLLSAYNEDYVWVNTYYPINPEENLRKAKPGLESEKISEIKHFPKPAQDQLTVLIPGEEGTLSDIQICDMTGKIMYHTKHQEAQIIIDVSMLKNGVYLLKVNSNGNIYQVKVAISK